MVSLTTPVCDFGWKTFAQALEIRERIQAGESLVKIAQEFGVSKSIISDIKRNVTYRGE